MISITNKEIQQLGRDRAVDRATRDAWHMAANKKPKRSVILHSVMIDEYTPPGPFAYRYRFVFEVD